MAKTDHLAGNIRALRRAAGMTQQELAVRLGVTSAAVSMLETGRIQPTVQILSRVMQHFNVTPNELFREGQGSVVQGEPSALQRVDEDAARMTPSVAVIVDRLLACVLGVEDLAGVPKHALTPLRVPLECSDAGLEALAERVRQHMRIYDGVVFDYFELFESFGLRVLALPLRISFMGACFYDARNDNAFFILNNRHTAERQLYTLATQLGRLHLHTWALHRGGYPATPKAARLDPAHAAAKFAAHFLMPARAVRSTIAQLGVAPHEWTYELLLRIKHRYGVSAEAFLYRLDDLDLIPREVKTRLKARIKTHYQTTGNREPDDSRRLLTPNGRLWDLVLTATLHLGTEHAELKEIMRDLKRMRVTRL
jgi:Zn-dependent peptidase ImmA (M78 family)/DNA-binding XRE family transcriptional regulator